MLIALQNYLPLLVSIFVIVQVSLFACIMNPSNCKQQRDQETVPSDEHDLDLNKLSLEPPPNVPVTDREKLHHITQLIATEKWGELNSFMRSHNCKISQDSAQMKEEYTTEEQTVSFECIGEKSRFVKIFSYGVLLTNYRKTQYIMPVGSNHQR